jgi:hypothetical protein
LRPISVLTELGQCRLDRLDLAVKPPGETAVDDLRAVDVGDPDVAEAIDPDPGIVGNQRDPMRVDPIALEPPIGVSQIIGKRA